MTSSPIARRRLSQVQSGSFMLSVLVIVHTGLGIGLLSGIEALTYAYLAVGILIVLVGVLVTALVLRWSVSSALSRTANAVWLAVSIPIFSALKIWLGEFCLSVPQILLSAVILVASILLLSIAPRAKRKTAHLRNNRDS